MTSNDVRAPADVLALLDGMADLPYGSERVDQRTHALQCAAHAMASAADDEVVVAAALHDIGRALPLARSARGAPHEDVGARAVGLWFGDRAGWIVGAHVAAKRCLVVIDPAYHETLSLASVASLIRQGGPMSADEVAHFQAEPWSEDALALRRWDDLSKDPTAAAADPDRVLAVMRRTWQG